jgi:NADH-quinone oxidoreductase chain G
MVTIYINNKKFKVKKTNTILQACSEKGIELPRFCYNEQLSVAGNCRMCLVEVQNSPKPLASCAVIVLENMKIFTNTVLVRKAREGVLEFLLANHPLDCPICDQGGECDLQDQSIIFGGDRGRYYEYKRAVEDKDCGLLIKTLMTRCIHCTRCVRFLEEVAGIKSFGTLGRGSLTEIGTYVNKVVFSEVSGNLIDLCPVGALTSKPYAFNARSWELRRVETICILDSYASNICIDLRGNEILRILPKYNKYINEEWISDRTRFSYDVLKSQRLLTPTLQHILGRKKLTWREMLYQYTILIDNCNQLNILCGEFVDMETLFLSKTFLNKKGYSYISAQISSELLEFDTRYHYLGDIGANIEEGIVILLGSDLRKELPLLNIKLRKLILDRKIKVISINSNLDLTYYQNNLGFNLKSLKTLLKGKTLLSFLLQNSKNIYFLVGINAMNREDFNQILKLLNKFKQDMVNNVYIKLLHTQLGKLGAYELGTFPGINDFYNYTFKLNCTKLSKKLFYLLGVNDFMLYSDDTIIYQGTHWDRRLEKYTLISGITYFAEANSTYINYEGIPQKTKFIQMPPKSLRDSWTIFQMLSYYWDNTKLNYYSLKQVRFALSILTTLTQNLKKNILILDINNYSKNIYLLNNVGIKLYNNASYLRNNVLRNSKLLIKCNNIIKKFNTNFI